MKIAIIIPAAGIGTRMKKNCPKQYLDIAGKPLICHTLERFRSFHQVVIVVAPERVDSFQTDILQHYDFPQWSVIEGGEKRQDSVRNGLNALSSDTEIVVVHDGVRPFVTHELIEQCISKAAEVGAAIVAVPVNDTIKHVDEIKNILQTIERAQLWRAQTPQTARYSLLKKAFDAAYRDNFYGTDEASLIERIGEKVAIVPGSERNIKITTPEDLRLAEFWLSQR
ncbi:MAG: 2-C-methyl-D-erythritol 4-phosphate cytidylyltransferase [Deltaproteobacteria bacterium RIFCSPLOWO2_02_FULL_44_10]|nr:MAG: 2-C-methyl-D-erythritol 4-phosphate cytidylyltransferase [Deltaproteobacteria bacterium RIFCSPHIGHO2_02_FULL_44_16]OGQ45502.1 MAG: 2-C-methyl-D-erythritol 4-phosphate cytidylyltransferase [Deltaproteobacteria bacterium RIFCSPLOWO2_02_FULL_44_10]